jgi:hypothetical protein
MPEGYVGDPYVASTERPLLIEVHNRRCPRIKAWRVWKGSHRLPAEAGGDQAGDASATQQSQQYPLQLPQRKRTRLICCHARRLDRH